jgi:hypothetical protein
MEAVIDPLLRDHQRRRAAHPAPPFAIRHPIVDPGRPILIFGPISRSRSADPDRPISISVRA